MPNAQHQYYLSCKHHAASPRRSSHTASSFEGLLTHGLFSALAHRPSSHMSKVRSFDCFRSFHGDLSPDMSCHGELASPAASSSSSSSSSSLSSSAIQVAGRHHRDRQQEANDRAYMRHQSAPVDVVPPCQWRSYREERRKKGGNGQRRRSFNEEEGEAMASREEEEEEEEEEDDAEEEGAQEEEERLPPHEELARERAAIRGGAAFSLCQGVGRTLKGRDLCRVRNAILKQTGFIS